MSEKGFTRTEVENALDLVLDGTTRKFNREEVSEKLEGMSDELKFIVVDKLTKHLVAMMKRHAESQGDPFTRFLSELFEKGEGCSCTKCSCEEPRVSILRNRKSDEDSDPFDFFKKFMGE